jgi:hypothetical protein
MLNDLGIAARGKQMTRVVETLKGEGTLVSSTAKNIVTYYLEVVEEAGIAPTSSALRTIAGCVALLYSDLELPIVGKIHVTPARWKSVAGVLQKTGMNCRDGRNSKRLTFSIRYSNGVIECSFARSNSNQTLANAL